MYIYIYVGLTRTANQLKNSKAGQPFVLKHFLTPSKTQSHKHNKDNSCQGGDEKPNAAGDNTLRDRSLQLAPSLLTYVVTFQAIEAKSGVAGSCVVGAEPSVLVSNLLLSPLSLKLLPFKRNNMICVLVTATGLPALGAHACSGCSRQAPLCQAITHLFTSKTLPRYIRRRSICAYYRKMGAQSHATASDKVVRQTKLCSLHCLPPFLAMHHLVV